MARFFTVQSRSDAVRLTAGGAPWPAGLQRANLGQGLYAWETLLEADVYRQVLLRHGANDLVILTYEAADIDIGGFAKLDLTQLSDDDVNVWMAQYSRYGQGLRHGFEYVVRNTDMGKEHYFAPAAFAKLR